ncbi:MAG TPA: DUF5018 domain-containing protein [Burkholderiaceae bacterium]|nr:DUF5018 domain-containing protein [Burkholderiaceae bacterium]
MINIHRVISTHRILKCINLGMATLLLSVFLAACGGSDSSTTTSVGGEFSAMGVKGTVNGQNVTIDLSGLGNCATTIENLVISVNASGASISPDPNVARDYSRPVEFTLTAPDGTKQVYTVTVKGADCLTAAGKYAGVWTGTCTPSMGEAIGPTDHTIDKFTITPTSATSFTLSIDTVIHTNAACNVVNGIRPTYALNIALEGTKTIAGGKTVDKAFYSRIGGGSFGKAIFYTNGAYLQLGDNVPVDVAGYPETMYPNLFYK